VGLKMNHEKILDIDPLIHAPIRLAALSILITVESANFSFLKESINTTDGNLSTHLSKLEEAGYVTVEKIFKDKKPQTIYAITDTGREAFNRYIDNLEKIVKEQKKSS
jgi:DNA-binding transcriptional ArsR family regulator